MLKKVWRWFFGGHDHKWKIIEEVRLTRRGPYDSEWVAYGKRRTLQCEHCGNLKTHIATGYV